jgi:uncharacterized membrane protein HdeD (DUF308 family)
MSDQSVSESVRKNWVWFLILGIVLVVCGLFAISMPLAAGWAVTWVLGWSLIVAGVVQVVQSFSVSSWGGLIWQIIVGLVMLVGGYLVFANPLASLLTVTVLIAWVFLVQGVAQVVMSFRVRPDDGWVWILISGIVSVVVALMIFNRFPTNAAYLPGLLAGISITFNGITYIIISMAARSAAPAEAVSPARELP